MPGRPVLRLNAYPATLLAAGTTVGIVLADRFTTISPSIWTLIGVPGLVIAFVVFGTTSRHLVSWRPAARTAAAILVCLAAGAFGHARMMQAPAGDPARQDSLMGEVVHIQGINPVEVAGGDRFTLSVSAIRGIAQAGGRILVLPVQREASYPDLKAGEVLQLTGRLERIPSRRNPADFDYRRYLARQRIFSRLVIAQPSDVARIGLANDFPERLVYAGRRMVSQRYATLLNAPETRGLVTTLVLGTRSTLDDDVRSTFVRTGLMHLLAISGLHILIVGMVIYALLRPLLLRLGLEWRAMEMGRMSITLGILLVYALLAGFQASVVRSVVMAAVMMGSVPAQRPHHPMNALGVAALVVLLVSPGQLFDVGFQLSFAAVAALIGLYPAVIAVFPEWLARNRVVEGFSVSVAATMGTAPVLGAHFGQVPLSGILLNLVGVPLSEILLATSLLMLGPWGGAFVTATQFLTDALVWLAAWGDEVLRWSLIRFELRNGWYLAGFVAVVLVPATLPIPTLRFKSMIAAGILFGLGFLTGALRNTPAMDILFFDVGQGDATLFRLPNGRAFLVDTGPSLRGNSAAQRILIPNLRYFGIRRLNAVVVTHEHNDHAGGLAFLKESLPYFRTYGSPHPLCAGDTLSIDPALVVLVLAPDCRRLPRDVNERSAVLRVTYGGTHFLLMADAGQATEAHLVAQHSTLLRAHVVKVGHHGSAHSSSAAFVAATGGARTHAVVSTGRVYASRWNRRSGAARWVEAGASVHATFLDGAIWFRSDGERVRRVKW